ncbi:MAG TPA: nickel pincer cofactor biosynthesis protein LarC [Gemmatimonadota bacterium]|nr:nickel pincer cofactor biosynthesis protein LarC [Gemmatimonadota bacterium]
MRIVWLDMFSGVSGDMLLGAWLGLGVPIEELRAALEPLGLEGVRLDVERVERHGIGATRCVVEVPDAAGHRGLREILDLVEGAGLPGRVAERAARVFRRLAEAEAKVHGTTPEEVHFHEVGALDAIVDVVGTAWCVERLGIERIHASRFTLGSGWTEAVHGSLPVPVPAVLELVAGWPVAEGRARAELTTPTGAALVTTLAEGRGLPADFVPEATAYGAGTRDLPEQPNLLRAVLGTAAGSEPLLVLECDLDDLSPALYEPLAEALEEAGARDVAWIPVQMKKRRPGVTVRALVPRGRLEAVGGALFRESTTIGYRYWAVEREILAREAAEVETSMGPVAVKRVRRPDGRWELRPEYEVCRRLARERGMAVREVVRALENELERVGRAEHQGDSTGI